MQQNIQPIKILLVEDNPGDVALTKEAFERGKFKVDLDVIMNGSIALNYIFKRDQYKDIISPDIILLDLNIPEIDGFEVLTQIKNNPETCHIPVVILTSSQADEDILKAYKDHANCFLTKPVDITQFLEIIQKFEEFWITIVKLPKNQ